MLHFLDYFFIVFHTCLIILNLFGWAWKPTRIANLISLSLTALSWFFLGIWYGFGFCPLTEWHWQVLEKLGVSDLPNNYITYLIYRVLGISINEVIVDWGTGILFSLAVIAAVWKQVSIRKRLKVS
jgi:hypothetical protein